MGSASQAELGRSTGIDRSDVTAALTGLEARNLIERRADPENKRRNIVTITPDGAGELAALDAVVGKVQDTLLSPLTQAQRREFVELLTRILEPTD